MPLIPDLNRKLPPKPTVKTFDPLAVQCPATDNAASALYAFVGEAPSSIEIMEETPFAGPAGKQLNRILAATNIARYDCFITNVCKAMLPNNNSDKLWTAKGWRCAAWQELRDRLIEELSTFPGRLIVPFGATAMVMLLDSPKMTAIGKHRGSPYPTNEFPDLRDRLPNKIILPTYHPAFTLPHKNPVAIWDIIADLNKAKVITDTPDVVRPPASLHIEPTFIAAKEWLHRALRASEIAFDIECTPKFITCFSIALSEGESMSIPLMNNSGNYWSLEEELEIWRLLAEVLAAPSVGVICQNGMFDIMFVLRTMDIVTDNFSFDTMLAQHIAYADQPKGLDYLTSRYTYYPYYKDEGKQSHLKVIKDWRAYWHYNAKDSAYLFPIKERLQEELSSLDGAPEAMAYSMSLHRPLMEMEFNGFRVDTEALTKRKHTLNAVVAKLQAALDKLVGRHLNINSNPQMTQFFYVEQNLTPYKNKAGNPSCDAVALHRIAKKKKPKKAIVAAKITIKLRKIKKLISTYFNIDFDADRRLRCSHSITGTKYGRISTEQTFFGTGANLQNQPPAFKKFLFPDTDHLLVEVDLAKAEAHVVAYLAQDANMIEAFESGVDVHSFNASKIFNIPLDQVSKAQRSMGKRVVHASNYGMGPGTFSNDLAKDDVFIPMGECRDLLEAYKRRFPGLKLWHKAIEQEIYNSKILFNLFGRPKRFLGMVNDNLLRSAYSFKPQSTVAELLNRGTIRIANDPELSHIDLITTVHDSDVFQIPYNKLHLLSDTLLRIRTHMTHEFHHKGKSFVIGLDAKLGTTWAGNTVEITDFSQESVDAALRKLGVPGGSTAEHPAQGKAAGYRG